MSRTTLYRRDLADGLPFLESSSMDGCLCDPPYHLTQASRGGSPRNNDQATPYGRTRIGERGFMGKTWDGGDIAFRPETWAEVLRVLKPGASLLCFGGTRTYHRLACAIEDAGFEIRDSIGVPGLAWIHAQGFPKSLDISKAIDKAAGETRPRVQGGAWNGPASYSGGYRSGEAISGEAITWDGYGTALKPAWESIVWAMAPLDGTYAENALKWGVAGLNVAGGRVAGLPEPTRFDPAKHNHEGWRFAATGEETAAKAERTAGRWPSNVVFCHHSECREVGVRKVKGDPREGQQRGFRPGGFGDVGAVSGSPLPAGPLYGDTEIPAWDCHPDCAVAELDRQSGETSVTGNRSGASAAAIVAGTNWGTANHRSTEYPSDSGAASRFFYQAKVSPSERNGSKHPTLKPIDLCRYLAKLILPPARKDEPRRLLVPFAGEGSEIIGALAAGWEEVTGIERDEEYIVNAAKRIRNTAPLIYQVDISPTEANP